MTVHHADCLDGMRGLAEASVDAIVCDPPYGLGFMGKDWDHGVPGEAFWREAWRVAKPGAHLVAFGGTRTYHRLACAIEDAGWEIRDCLSWLYGSGFPKSLDVSKAMDKRGGYPHLAAQIGEALKSARESRGLTVGECDKRFCGGTTNWSWFEGRPKGQRAPTPETFAAIAAEWPEVAHLAESVAEAEREVVERRTMIQGGGNSLQIRAGERREVEANITAPATDLARQWQGWGTALKPAWEPIILARKPLVGTVAANVAAHGTGALNVDGCRIVRAADDVSGWSATGSPASENRAMSGANYARAPKPDASGRWPANVCLDEDAAAMLDAQTGDTTSAGGSRGAGGRHGAYSPIAAQDIGPLGYGDTGGASRFFYCAKASRREREAGLEGMPEQEKRWGGSIQDARPHTAEGYKYEAKARNVHPTVKPIALMRWLCRLVTPPGGLILDPFTGSGSTGCAAVAEGFRFVGFEQDAEYAEIARRRIAHWAGEAVRDNASGATLPLFEAVG